MKFTKSQKMSLSVLALAVGAYILDQCFGESGVLHAPVPSAEHSATVQEGMPTAMVETPAAGGGDSAASMLAARMDAIKAVRRNGFPVRDAFAIPSGFQTGIDAEQLSNNDRILKFTSSHKLKAIINSNGNCQAVVDASLIRVGQSLDGFRLESVNQMKALFLNGDMHAELSITQSDETSH